ncbi:MAG: two component sensor histidine kinase, partial [Paenibacillus sp.]|nr:two component sensor histidine kinase [Paenibacillus sp.]
MGTLRIRTFLLLCLCFFLLLPWMFYLAVYAMENQTIRFATSRTFNETITSRINEMIAFIDANADSWGQPGWQNELRAKLRQSELDAALLSASGENLFRSSPENGGAFKSAERYSIIKDGVIAGTVVLYVPKASALPVHALVAGILLALFVIAMQMRRFLLKPLEGLCAAARQVAAG